MSKTHPPDIAMTRNSRGIFVPESEIMLRPPSWLKRLGQRIVKFIAFLVFFWTMLRLLTHVVRASRRVGP